MKFLTCLTAGIPLEATLWLFSDMVQKATVLLSVNSLTRLTALTLYMQQ